MQKHEYVIQYDHHAPGRVPERRAAIGWYTNDGNRIKGFVKHEGIPWSVSPYNLLPDIAKKSGYVVKLEIDDTGAGRTSWMFEIKTADVAEDSVSMAPAVFWDKVSMATQPDGTYLFQDRVVDSIQINFAPRRQDSRAFTSMYEGGRL